MREIKFRAWDGNNMYPDVWMTGSREVYDPNGGFWRKVISIMQFTGFRDSKGEEIYEGDILEFSDKWEWYRGQYGIKMHFASGKKLAELQKQYEAEPMERRKISMPDCYEWILSSEIQTYWSVIGNIYEHPNLIK